MLSPDELQEWIQGLAPTNEARKRIIVDLIRHANEDSMSVDDRADCRKAFGLLLTNGVPEAPGPKHVEVPNGIDTEH